MSIENGKLGLKTAELYTLAWKKDVKAYINSLPDDKLPRAFTIRRAELEFLLLQMTIKECDASRMYMGLKPSESVPGQVDPCLIMTGVRAFTPDFKNPAKSVPGKEIYFTEFPMNVDGTYPTNPAGDPDPDYVLDFAYPCPDTCQTGSPLMGP